MVAFTFRVWIGTCWCNNQLLRMCRSCQDLGMDLLHIYAGCRDGLCIFGSLHLVWMLFGMSSLHPFTFLMFLLPLCNSMVGSEIWDKYQEYCSGSGKIARGEVDPECNLPFLPKYEWYLSQLSRPTMLSQINTKQPHSTPAYLQVQEHAHAAFVARRVGII